MGIEKVGEERGIVCSHRDAYVIDKELQHFDDFILCVALFTFRFVRYKIS